MNSKSFNQDFEEKKEKYSSKKNKRAKLVHNEKNKYKHNFNTDDY